MVLPHSQSLVMRTCVLNVHCICSCVCEVNRRWHCYMHCNKYVSLSCRLDHKHTVTGQVGPAEGLLHAGGCCCVAMS